MNLSVQRGDCQQLLLLVREYSFNTQQRFLNYIVLIIHLFFSGYHFIVHPIDGHLINAAIFKQAQFSVRKT